MSERTFRAVIAAVLVGALVLAVLVVVSLMPRSATPEPTPAPTVVEPTAQEPPSSPAQTAAAPWAAAELVGVGAVAQGSESGSAFVLKMAELAVDSIPDAPGSFRLTLTDAAGDPSTIEFVGTPVIDAPGSFGLTTTLVATNVLMVSIEAADTLNVEPITIKGLRIRAGSAAALGPVSLQIGEFTGSLAGGVGDGDLPPIGTVVAAP